MHARTLALTAVLAVGLAPTAVADWSGTETTVDGQRLIRNPDTPMNPARTVELEELWRVGGYSDDDDQIFGVVAEIQADEDGNVYLLDGQLSEIRIFDADGQFVDVIGRSGEAPGEFNAAADFVFMPDGSIAVLQLFPGRLVHLTSEGDPLDDVPLPKVEGFFGLLNAAASPSNTVFGAFVSNPQGDHLEQTRYLMSIDDEGNEVTRYHEEVRTLEFANLVMDEAVWDSFDNRWTVGRDGRVYAVIGNDQYRVHVWNPDGTFDRIVERAYEPLERTDEERQRVEDRFRQFTRAQMPNASFKIRENHRGVEQIFVRDDNSLWVVSSRGLRTPPEGTIVQFDVFDPEGHFVDQVNMTGSATLDVENDRMLFAKDRLYVITDFMSAVAAAQGAGAGGDDEEEIDEDAEPLAVICYQLTESTPPN